MLRVKMICTQVTNGGPAGGCDLFLRPAVLAGRAVPDPFVRSVYGSLHLGELRPEAAGELRPGREYLLTLEPCD